MGSGHECLETVPGGVCDRSVRVPGLVSHWLERGGQINLRAAGGVGIWGGLMQPGLHPEVERTIECHPEPALCAPSLTPALRVLPVSLVAFSDGELTTSPHSPSCPGHHSSPYTVLRSPQMQPQPPSLHSRVLALLAGTILNPGDVEGRRQTQACPQGVSSLTSLITTHNTPVRWAGQALELIPFSRKRLGVMMVVAFILGA